MISKERYEELKSWYLQESNDEDTQKWRNNLSKEEEKIVDEWNDEYAGAIIKISNEIIRLTKEGEARDNYTIAIGTELTPFDHKPEKYEIGNIVQHISNKSISLIDLQRHIGKGATIRPAVIDQDKRFVSQQIFGLDFDDVEFHRIETLIIENNIFPSIIYSTFSQKADEPVRNFRMLFLSNKPITNLLIRNAILNKLFEIFGNQNDTKCRDTSRIFFGGKIISTCFVQRYDFEIIFGITVENADEIAKK